MFPLVLLVFFFFFNDTATTEIYTLSLHDALPISAILKAKRCPKPSPISVKQSTSASKTRSEEHTSELQSQSNLVCRLLLEKKKNPPHPPSWCNSTTPMLSRYCRRALCFLSPPCIV